MDKELENAMLVQQLRQKHALKQQCLHGGETSSPLHAEADKLLALAKVAGEDAEGLSFASLLKKEQRFLESILTEMQASYDSMPEAMQASVTGQYARNSVLMTRGALHRLQTAETATPQDLPQLLEEAAFLLDGADGRT
jgi:hypothetical protein